MCKFHFSLPIAVGVLVSYAARKADEINVATGLTPKAVTAAAVYMASNASGKDITSSEVVEATVVDNIKLREAYETMHPSATNLFPKDFNFKNNILPFWITIGS